MTPNTSAPQLVDDRALPCASPGRIDEGRCMTPSEAIRKAQEALTAPPMTTDEVKAHWSMVAAVRAADERAREPSPQFEMKDL